MKKRLHEKLFGVFSKKIFKSLNKMRSDVLFSGLERKAFLTAE